MANKTTKEIIENNCAKCAYCAKHYVNINGTFQSANCMHCINGSISKQLRKNLIANKVKCEYWQPEQIQIEQRRQNIEYYLRTTARKLDEIAQILKEDYKINK